ncbi:hypothetical protein FB566_3032 [Stackebrandtia endophytica]|uniref:Uncharacterized protein n=1 Tax=Stackebrandtia endophytica TaxID=1496996 RepID=A0A543AY24_9ACTN|nr:permease prefix domain 1-containing protein [Stackebrandtia endophytica]TQL77473.1 hypothetical protein FB566_3032 [Stackebrandtia endophytica]
MTTIVDDLIDRRVAELAARLNGSRRATADILREVRHGLTDAAQGYRDDGMPPEEAARAAIDEFGEPTELAREFQVELVSRQTRLALGFVAASGPVSEVLSRIQWSNSSYAPVSAPPEYTYFLALFMDVQGWALSLFAVGMLLVMGFGVRRFAFRVRMAQAVAVGILAKVVVVSVAGVALMYLFGVPVMADGALGIALGLLYPLTTVYLAWLAWRCARTATWANRLAVA